MTEQAFYVILLAIASLLGIRGSWRVFRRYRYATDTGVMTAPERLLLGTLVVVCWTITAAALYFGFIATRRLMGLDGLTFLAPFSLTVALGVLLLPAGIDLVIEKIAKWDIR